MEEVVHELKFHAVRFAKYNIDKKNMVNVQRQATCELKWLTIEAINIRFNALYDKVYVEGKKDE